MYVEILFSKMRFIVMFVTAVCVLFLIKLRWPKKKGIYDLVFVLYGQETLSTVRVYEKDLSRSRIDLSI